MEAVFGLIGVVVGAAAALLGVMAVQEGKDPYPIRGTQSVAALPQDDIKGRDQDDTRGTAQGDNGDRRGEEKRAREMTPEEERELRHWLNLLSYDGTEQEDDDAGGDRAR